MSSENRVEHLIDPVYNEQSKILILGTFPSVKSREANFFYNHPQNRFWRVIATLCEVEVPITIEDKKRMLLDHRIAVWDVIKSCEINGSSDSSIKHVIPTELEEVLSVAPIEKIFLNGKKAHQLYCKYCQNKYNINIEVLPSTSPANAVYTLDKLLDSWQVIREILNIEKKN